MLIIGAGSSDAHARIQVWRRAHPYGYLVNYRSRSNAMIHSSGYCPHLGDTEWEAGHKNWGSMGNSTKLLSESRAELEKWARAETIVLKTCSDCQT